MLLLHIVRIFYFVHYQDKMKRKKQLQMD